MRAVRTTIVGVALLTAAACASSGSVSQQGTTRRSQGVITQAEMDSVDASNMLQVIQILRPMYLQERGGVQTLNSAPAPIMVYIDEQRLGPVSQLAQMSKSEFREVRYYTASEAQTRFGPGNTRGVIQLRRKSSK